MLAVIKLKFMDKSKGIRFSKIIDKVKSNKKLQCVLVVALIVAFFIISFTNFSVSDTNNKVESNSTVNQYVNELEIKLAKVLSDVKGVGKVSVIINVESGMESVVATDINVNQTQSGTVKTEKPIIVNGKTVVLKELYPKIVGVILVCQGADNISVRAKIQQATMSLLNIDSNQIEILTMS